MRIGDIGKLRQPPNLHGLEVISYTVLGLCQDATTPAAEKVPSECFVTGHDFESCRKDLHSVCLSRL